MMRFEIGWRVDCCFDGAIKGKGLGTNHVTPFACPPFRGADVRHYSLFHQLFKNVQIPLVHVILSLIFGKQRFGAFQFFSIAHKANK